MTQVFANQIILALLTGSQENGQDAVIGALGFESVNQVSVYTAEGKLLLSSVDVPNNRLISNNTSLLSEKQVIEYGQAWLFSSPVIYIEESFDTSTVDPSDENIEQQILGYVTVEYDKQALREIQQSIFFSNLAIGVVVALILSMAIRFMLKRLTQPLLVLSQIMEQANISGNYPKAKELGALEVRFIAHSYNKMMSTLDNKIAHWPRVKIR